MDGVESETTAGRGFWLAPFVTMVLACALFAVANATTHRAKEDLAGLSILRPDANLHPNLPPPEFAADATARQLWTLTEMALLLAEVLVGARLCQLVWKSVGSSCQSMVQSVSRHLGAFVAILGLAAIGAACVMAAVNNPLRHAIRDCLLPSDLVWSSRITTASDIAAVAVVLLIALSLSLVSRVRIGGGGKEDTRQTAEHLRQLTSILYMSSALLVLGTLEVAALHHWSEAQFRSTSPEHILLHQLSNATALSAGGFFTLLLAAGYLPALGILRDRARELERYCNRGPDAVTPSRWMKTKELLDGGHLLALQRVLVILAPVIAGGTATEIVSKIASVAK